MHTLAGALRGAWAAAERCLFRFGALFAGTQSRGPKNKRMAKRRRLAEASDEQVKNNRAGRARFVPRGGNELKHHQDALLLRLVRFQYSEPSVARAGRTTPPTPSRRQIPKYSKTTQRPKTETSTHAQAATMPKRLSLRGHAQQRQAASA